ncbi:MAG: bifunctional riboflavin kinase/FAD synthetase [Cellulosilyticaceae bacterium]
MQYICGKEHIELNKETVVALGNFDGVHRGHQKLLEVAKNIASEKGYKTVVLSFYPHPTRVLMDAPKPLVMSRDDRKNKMQQMGMDYFIEYPFTKEFSKISPREFFEEILLEQLKAKIIVVGRNYFFGKNKQGDINFLQMMGKIHNIEIHVIDIVQNEQEIISSTQIRQLIQDGKIVEAEKLLGHPYTIVGTVVHGKKIGRTIGFPTLNVIADLDRIYPPNGVYATMVKVNKTEYMGVTNIGFNPTIGNSIKMIETHLFNFDKMIYGEQIEVCFYDYIRAEKKFESIEALKQQIQQDQEKARFLLEDKMK